MDDIAQKLRDRAAEQRRNNSYLVDAAMDDEAADEIGRLRLAIVRFGDRVKMANVEPMDLQQTIDRAFEARPK